MLQKMKLKLHEATCMRESERGAEATFTACVWRSEQPIQPLSIRATCIVAAAALCINNGVPPVRSAPKVEFKSTPLHAIPNVFMGFDGGKKCTELL